LYSKKIFKSKRNKNCFVISVGNITVGGTGKTPLVEYLSKYMTELGKKTAIASKRYNNKYENDKRIRIVTNGKELLMKHIEAGDEPYMLALKLKKVPIILNKNRFKAINSAVSMFDTEVIILDDAFQRRDIHKDLEILVFDGTTNINNFSMFPSGILRLPAQSITRADICIINKVKNSQSAQKIFEYIRKYDNSIPIFFSDYNFSSFHQLNNDMPINLDTIKNKEITIFAGIGNISKFDDMIKSELAPASINLIKFPDHYQYTPSDIKRILMFCNISDYVITTHKDAVKLKNKAEFPNNFLYSIISLKFEKEHMFKNTVKYYLKLSALI
ncbi:MAG TPA: tetraacyldisaccharide 4'-kinase, partial [bacterium]|nr:tetraacyldisaccharide 4'-kinase [bacterium]